MAGIPIATIKDLLGHASLAMTMRYAHLNAKVLTEGIQILASWKEAEAERINETVVGLFDNAVNTD